jgi:clostripain
VPGVYGRLAWCRDGATEGDGAVQNWFELLDSWFDAGAANGGRNGYQH